MTGFIPNPPLPDLQTGDQMLFSPSDAPGVIIAVKTWTWLSHVEVYAGAGKSYAARAEGINIYAERVDKYLRYIRRPEMPPGKTFDPQAAYAAIAKQIGKPYPFWTFENFYNPWAKQRCALGVCSVLATEYLIGGGCVPFNPEMDPEDASPAQLYQTPNLQTIWERATAKTQKLWRW